MGPSCRASTGKFVWVMQLSVGRHERPWLNLALFLRPHDARATLARRNSLDIPLAGAVLIIPHPLNTNPRINARESTQLDSPRPELHLLIVVLLTRDRPHDSLT